MWCLTIGLISLSFGGAHLHSSSHLRATNSLSSWELQLYGSARVTCTHMAVSVSFEPLWNIQMVNSIILLSEGLI
jgi:hypothetical protein